VLGAVLQLRGINLPTADVIEYDVAKLEAMTGEQLLLQLIARKDLERPKREHRLNARKIQEAALATLQEAADGLREKNLDHFAAQLDEIAAEYMAAGPVVVK